ncbi:T9SS type A sorting domain-containing protein [Flavobacterium sp. LC2016-23]|uniref:T9SS type A sorting domain-containing protein n=1 Tax=Flavobacterium sp. LC2016-23 TaxID=2666330 RepID=UPI0012AF3812|nr:T9SS type A sorting domain-containing protein [Flavobacterium sp. LC2016-23]MRX41848.1 T9SS type A sorting domain-containing protein [Flavobacterium sp. LC2016-23]
MKLIFSLLLFATLTSSFAQQKITFGYDTAGNQTSRTLCLTGCTAKPGKEIKEIEAITEEDLEKFFSEDVISYYPNPVKEELYLKWGLTDDNIVLSIVVYGLNGQLLKSYSGTDRTNAQNIAFQSYGTGVYLVVLNYKNGDQKTIKIIKQ